jgi:hypothetical protein
LWRWGASSESSHLLQIQDDVIVSPNFWPSLRAMIAAQPSRIIGLHANHPLSVVQHRAGRHWYRDHWLTGPAYVFPTDLLRNKFLPWCDVNPVLVASTNEDSLVSLWSHRSGYEIWHPVPTITDVDLSIPSTYGNDAHHEWSMYRQPSVTWRDATSLAALEDPQFWACSETAAPKLPGPGSQLCWFCAEEQGHWCSAQTGARLGRMCMMRAFGSTMGIEIGSVAPKLDLPAGFSPVARVGDKVTV